MFSYKRYSWVLFPWCLFVLRLSMWMKEPHIDSTTMTLTALWLWPLPIIIIIIISFLIFTFPMWASSIYFPRHWWLWVEGILKPFIIFILNLFKRPFHQGLFCPDSTRSFFWSIGRIFAKIVWNLQALLSTTLYLRRKIWRDCLSPPKVGNWKSDRPRVPWSKKITILYDII